MNRTSLRRVLVEHPERSTPLTRAISKVAGAVGSFPAIVLAVGLVIAWVGLGLFADSDSRSRSYELLTMVGTVTTFVMVFIIQNSQNREGRAVQTKLDAQGHALHHILEKMGIDHEIALSELAGLEEAPETDIKEEQHHVRNKKKKQPAAAGAEP
ncbi:MAG TPA: low affinity iron permease family protein [Candidatus Paceibacterota bacterium]|nr:low affinity iron permease family protein [Candidatus Paceibacterota bacterium]